MRYIVWLAMLACFPLGAVSGNLFSVCRALANRGSINGTIVSIRGIWIQDEDNSYLLGIDCGSVNERGRKRKPNIFLDAATGELLKLRLKNEEKVAPVLSRMTRRLQSRASTHPMAVVLTFEGIFEVATPEPETGRLRGLGHTGGYLTRLLYFDVRDPTLVKFNRAK